MDPEILEVANRLGDMPTREFLKVKKMVFGQGQESMPIALPSNAAPHARKRPGRKPKTSNVVKPQAVSPKPNGGTSAYAKRNEGEDVTTSGIYDAIESNPVPGGVSAMLIRSATGGSKNSISKAIKELERDGRVTRLGEKRLTRYFLADNPAWTAKLSNAASEVASDDVESDGPGLDRDIDY